MHPARFTKQLLDSRYLCRIIVAASWGLWSAAITAAVSYRWITATAINRSSAAITRTTAAATAISRTTGATTALSGIATIFTSAHWTITGKSSRSVVDMRIV